MNPEKYHVPIREVNSSLRSVRRMCMVSPISQCALRTKLLEMHVCTHACCTILICINAQRTAWHTHTCSTEQSSMFARIPARRSTCKRQCEPRISPVFQALSCVCAIVNDDIWCQCVCVCRKNRQLENTINYCSFAIALKAFVTDNLVELFVSSEICCHARTRTARGNMCKNMNCYAAILLLRQSAGI